tara:strand:- start:4464 stop:4706 length:243 start_codon:yes stop_codon:yes gene_type:complete
MVDKIKISQQIKKQLTLAIHDFESKTSWGFIFDFFWDLGFFGLRLFLFIVTLVLLFVFLVFSLLFVFFVLFATFSCVHLV